MKRYYNATTKEWYTEGNSITKNISNGVFSGIPSEQQLTEWGFEEYIQPTPTPEELLARAKSAKIAELEDYDDLVEKMNEEEYNMEDTFILMDDIIFDIQEFANGKFEEYPDDDIFEDLFDLDKD